MLGPTLLSLHNLAYYLRLMREAREAIREGRFTEYRLAATRRLCGAEREDGEDGRET
jgi:queuine tRNA-ribosyltransferase